MVLLILYSFIWDYGSFSSLSLFFPRVVRKSLKCSWGPLHEINSPYLIKKLLFAKPNECPLCSVHV